MGIKLKVTETKKALTFNGHFTTRECAWKYFLNAGTSSQEHKIVSV